MYTHLLVAVDGSATAEKALREALALAGSSGARVTVLCVVNLYLALADMQGATETLYEQHVDAMRRQARAILNHAADLATAAGVPFETILRETKVGRAGEAIAAEAANGYDLLVIGTHGRRGLQRVLLGSDAELVLRTAPVPVLLVRG